MTDPERTALLEEARRHFSTGRLGDASDLCQQMLARWPDDADVVTTSAIVALELNEPATSESLARRSAELRPEAAESQIVLGMIMTRLGRFDDALTHYSNASRLDPDDLRGITGRAMVHEQRGDHARGLAELEPIVDRGEEDANVVCQYTRLQTHLEQYDRVIEVGQRALKRTQMTKEQRAVTFFAVGKALERAGRTDEAFEAYTAANAHQPVSFDIAAATQAHQALIDLLPAKRFAELPRAPAPSDTLIFIVGMPRSGTTLTEFILDAHPMVHGIGEFMGMGKLSGNLSEAIRSTLPYPQCMTDLDQSHVNNLSSQYMQILRRVIGPVAPEVRCFADKAVVNHTHVGLIALLFPNARIVWLRRNPDDNCLACFGEQLSVHYHSWAVDLYSTGVVYRLHERLMEHWRSALDLPVMELQYEQLVQEPETMTRRLVEFCGLPWDDACMRHHESDRIARTLSHEQVRQPIYTSSVGRAAPFEQYLGPLRAGLAAGAHL